MGADNWAVCPQCLFRANDALQRLEVRTQESYGVVPIEEFNAMRAEVEKGVDAENLRTLREDYEIGMETNGEFSVSYECHCGTCEFAHKVTRADKVELKLVAPSTKRERRR